MKHTVKVFSGNEKEVSFEVAIHHRIRKELQLPLEEFYQRWTGKVPEENYEMEVVSSSIPESVYKSQNLHIHYGEDAKPYVCFPPQIISLEEAENVLKHWAIVTVHQYLTGIDPNDLESFGSFVGGEYTFWKILPWLKKTKNYSYEIFHDTFFLRGISILYSKIAHIDS